MSPKDPRKAYWNDQYVKYWHERVDEAGVGKSKIIKGDNKTEDDSVYHTVFQKNPPNPGSVLDVGCAWGRMFPTYDRLSLKITGIDISKAMIEEAREQWANASCVTDLRESSAEELPFPESSFDNLCCLAVFDATFQNQAMSEFLRVTRPGAKIYVTGKNDGYFDEDLEAFNAEVGARKKKHPNFFTNTRKLVTLLEAEGHIIDQAYYFPRRGDFAAFRYSSTIPERFYEFFLVITRGASYSSLPCISDAYSNTFKSLGRRESSK